jgi:hypothetical protein
VSSPACFFPGSGSISASSIAYGGQNYVAGEAFSIVVSPLSGDPCALATGVIDTVDGSGSVTSYHLTYTGDCYLFTPVQDTMVAPGDPGGGTFTINITGVTVP